MGLEEINAGKVILVDPDGSVADGAGPRHIEYPIHTEIMAARPDVGSVVHTHSAAANEFAALDVPLRPIDHAGSLFCYPDVPRFTLTGGLRDHSGAGAASRTPWPSGPMSGPTGRSRPAGSTCSAGRCRPADPVARVVTYPC